MWSRRKIKERAKEALRRNYWKIVLMSALLFLLGCETGGLSFSKRSYGSESNSHETRVEQAADATEQIVTVTEDVPPGEGVAQMIGRGEIEPEDFEIDLFGIIVIGITSVIIFTAVFLLIFSVILLVDIFLINPFDVGGKRFMRLSVEDVAQVKEIAYGFDHSYKNVVKVMFFRELYTFLWTLLFIIPGIVKMYQYLLVPYILSEQPDMEYHAALQLSRDMMEGNKWRAFVLGLSFILWDLLGAITFGVVEFLYVHPYRSLTFAALYCELKQEHVKNTLVMNNDGQ